MQYHRRYVTGRAASRDRLHLRDQPEIAAASLRWRVTDSSDPRLGIAAFLTQKPEAVSLSGSGQLLDPWFPEILYLEGNDRDLKWSGFSG